MPDRLSRYETLLGSDTVLGLREDAERAAAKRNKGELKIAKRKHVGKARARREMTALSAGRDALSLIGGGDVSQRETLLSGQLDLPDAQRQDIIEDDLKRELKRKEQEVFAGLSRPGVGRQVSRMVSNEGISVREARRRVLGLA